MSGPPLPAQLLHLAVLQLVTRSAPFSHCRALPLDALTDLTGCVLSLVGAAARQHAERSGRTDASAWDAIAALDEFSLLEGVGELHEEAREGVAEERARERRRARALAAEQARQAGEMDSMAEPVDKQQRQEDENDVMVERLRELASTMTDYVKMDERPRLGQRIVYDALTDDELMALTSLPPPVKAEPEDVDDEESASEAPSPATPADDGATLRTRVKREDNDLQSWALVDATGDHVQDEDEVEVDVKEARQPQPVPRRGVADAQWISAEAVPTFVPDFLPPFPGLEMERAEVVEERARRARIEQEQRAQREREAAAQSRAIKRRFALSSTHDPWAGPIPYAASTIAEMNAEPHLPRLSPSPPSTPPEGQPEASTSTALEPSRKRLRSSSPEGTEGTSLAAYKTTSARLAVQPERAYGFNPDRRQAAAVIGIHPDASTSVDSLFGHIPVDRIRTAFMHAGFVPDFVNYPHPLNPFKGALPYTVSTPVPPHPSPHAPLAVPSPHPNLPTTLSRLASVLAHPGSAHLSMFSRLLRTGPPGPLDSQGMPMDYSYQGVTSLVSPPVEFPARQRNVRLAARDKDDGAAAAAAAGSPAQIKLSLKLSRGRSESAGPSGGVGSPFVSTSGAVSGSVPAGWPGAHPGQYSTRQGSQTPGATSVAGTPAGGYIPFFAGSPQATAPRTPSVVSTPVPSAAPFAGPSSSMQE